MVNKNLKYPVYIVSKGRWENPLTAKYFLRDGIKFKIAVEPQEYDNYCKAIGKDYVLELPFSNLGLGSYPARNYCWEDSIQNGYKRHFLFDDNIRGFVAFNKGERRVDNSLSCFLPLKTLEDFTDRYNNVAISGYNYIYFTTKQTKKPFTYNTHVYSGMLINNEISYRWRLKYNEDIDLCLQALHNGWCTILLNVFLIRKTSTVAMMKGGNQAELYCNNDHKKKMLKAKSLELMWPQYCKTTYRFNRPHHSIDWKKHFKQSLIKVSP